MSELHHRWSSVFSHRPAEGRSASRRVPVRLALPLLAVFAAGCPGGTTDAGVGDSDDGGASAPDAGEQPKVYDVDVEPVCTDGIRFAAGTPAFVEATAAWGLDRIGAQGTRLAVADIDGDGRSDLFVRRGGSRSDDFGADGARHSWLLRNTGAGFEDVTEQSGALTPRGDLGGRARPFEIVAFADVDNDGDQDLYTGLATADPQVAEGETSELMLNDGTGTFVLGPDDNDLRRPGLVDAVAGASFVDIDLDGLVDLWTPQHNFDLGGGTIFSQDYAYRGLGTGAFDDQTSNWGLTTEDWVSIDDLNQGRAHSRAWGAAACDLNGDGLTELLAPSYGRSPNHLWMGALDFGAVRFANRSVASGYAYDDDQAWQDNQFARCYCQDNPNAQDCAGVPAPVLVCSPNWNHVTDREPFRLGGNSGASVCGDVDNDGDLDVLTTEIKHWWAGESADGSELLVNISTDEVVFERPGDAALGLAIDHSASVSWDEGHMTAAIFDFDNDAWPDLYIGGSDYAGNRGRLYHQTAPLSFEEVLPADGIDHNRSHGIAVLDVDRDGDLDVIVGHSRARCDANAPNNCYETAQVRAFENVLGDGGNWMQLDLVGTGDANRDAIGARVTVTAGDVTQTQDISAGHGHYGAQNDHILHFGLGGACDATVTVRWPTVDGETETYSLAGGHRYRITMGEGATLADD